MVQVIAHRGASAVERENTVAAFRRARVMGAHAVELDVRRSADGVLVVHHDPVVGDSGRAVIDTARALLPGHVPTLAEALDACAGMWVNIEIKNDPTEADFDPDDRLADAVVEALVASGESSRWLISSFRLETVTRCHMLAPEIATAWLTVEAPAGSPERIGALGLAALHPWYGVVDESLVQECHRHGLAVNVWTCDDPDAMRRLAAWGVDGICTNVPDLALAVLAP